MGKDPLYRIVSLLMKRIKGCIFIFSLLILVGLLYWSSRDENAALCAVRSISRSQYEALLSNTNSLSRSARPQGYLKINGVAAPYDTETQTYYVPESLSTDAFSANLSWSDASHKVYICREDFSKAQLLREGIRVPLLIKKNQTYYEQSVCFTGMPMMVLNSSDAFSILYGNGDTGGELVVFDPDGSQGYQITKSYVSYRPRGNTTLTYRHIEKDQHTFHFYNKQGERTAVSLLGLAPSDKFKTVGMLYDHSCLRDAFGLGIWNDWMAAEGLHSRQSATFRYTEMILNGQYYGLFLFMRDPAVLDADAISAYDYVYKVKKPVYASQELPYDLNATFAKVEVKYPISMDFSTLLNPIQSYLNAFTPLNTTISWQELVELLDLDNMVDYTLFCLLLDASDNNYLNFFLLKTNDGCYVRIPWDLDRTLTRYRAYDDLWPSFSLPFEAASLLDKGADGFASLLSQRWDALRQSHFAQEALLSRLDALSYLITESGALAREHQRWREPDDLIPVERFQDYLPYRLSDLDAYLDQLSSHYALDMNPFRRPIE